MLGNLTDCGDFAVLIFMLWSLLLTGATLLGLILTIRQKRPFIMLFSELLLFAVCEIFQKFFIILLRFPEKADACPILKKIPLLSAAALLVALTAGTAAFLIRRIHWSKNHISDMSIKESFDSLPTGVCFYYENGFVGLVNNKMNELALEITGKSILNGLEFMRQLCDGTISQSCTCLRFGENPIIKTSAEKIYRFTQYIEFEDGRRLFEIIADDITELYRKTERLRKNNAELKARGERLLRYSQNITAEIREKEILNAKIKVHDNMNRLLLATRRCIDENCGAAERAGIFSLWHGNIIAFSDEEEKNPRNDLLEASKLLGIELEFRGEIPQDIVRQNVITLAAAECMTNAVRHAEAKKLIIDISPNKVLFTNDGKVPIEKIREGGGLSTVRKKIEELHGEMLIQSAPEFKLILNFPE